MDEKGFLGHLDQGRRYGTWESKACGAFSAIPHPHPESERKPKVLHFSNGVIVEHESPPLKETIENETGEDVLDTHKSTVNLVSNMYDNTGQYWTGQLVRLTTNIGKTTVQVCDYVGEKVAKFLGITTPKYQFEINEYHRTVDADKAYKAKMDVECAGWRNTDSNISNPKEAVVYVDKNS